MKKTLVIGDARGISLLLNDLVREGHDVEWWQSLEHGAGGLAAGKEEFDLIVICANAELEVVAEAAFDMAMSAINVPRIVAVWNGEIKKDIDIGCIDKIVPDFAVGEILSVFRPASGEGPSQ